MGASQGWSCNELASKCSRCRIAEAVCVHASKAQQSLSDFAAAYWRNNRPAFYCAVASPYTTLSMMYLCQAYQSVRFPIGPQIPQDVFGTHFGYNCTLLNALACTQDFHCMVLASLPLLI